MTNVFIDYLDDDTPSRQWFSDHVPRIDEKVGARHIEGQGPNVFFLDTVVDVRHYPDEIRILTASSRP